MKIDILSDLHIDFYLSKGNVNARKIKLLFEPIITNNGTRKAGDILIVAGDIGHHNTQNIEVLKVLKNEYYKHVICVLGNHDYYLVSSNAKNNYKINSFSRTAEMRKLINNEENIYCLDGSLIEIDGIKFGGCDSSYSDAYSKAYFPLLDNHKVDNAFWKDSVNDYRFIYGIKDFDELYKIELPKMEAIYKKCDVMITHVNPSYLHKHISPSYEGQRSNMFFTFDGHRFMKNGSMKYWVFGHTHDAIEYELHGVKCICNPLGYPYENKNIKMKSITI